MGIRNRRTTQSDGMDRRSNAAGTFTTGCQGVGPQASDEGLNRRAAYLVGHGNLPNDSTLTRDEVARIIKTHEGES